MKMEEWKSLFKKKIPHLHNYVDTCINLLQYSSVTIISYNFHSIQWLIK
jgi:hypothetical protein